MPTTTVLPIIGMSPGNSYFKDEEIRFLLQETVAEYQRVAVLIADIPAISTYRAFGYPENRARTKAVLKGNNLKNRTKKIMAELGFSEQEVRIVDWLNEAEDNPDYQRIFDRKIKTFYETNEQFRRAVQATTQEVLDHSDRSFDNLEHAVEIAVHYLLSEIAFLEFAPQFFHVPKISYVYHRNWPVYEEYISGKFDGLPKLHLDFLLLENAYEKYKITTQSQALPVASNSKTTLRVAYDDYFPAFLTDQDTGERSGIFYEMLVEIARRLEMSVEWSEETGYGAIVEGLAAKRFDLFGSTVWPTPEREGKALFSHSLYPSEVFAWSAKDDLRDYAAARSNRFLRIAIKEDDISHSIAKSEFPNARSVRIPQLADPLVLLRFVAEGRADITFVEPLQIEYFFERTGILLERIDALGRLRVYENTFLIARERLDLKKAFDEQIEILRQEGFLDRVKKKYL